MPNHVRLPRVILGSVILTSTSQFILYHHTSAILPSTPGCLYHVYVLSNDQLALWLKPPCFNLGFTPSAETRLSLIPLRLLRDGLLIYKASWRSWRMQSNPVNVRDKLGSYMSSLRTTGLSFWRDSRAFLRTRNGAGWIITNYSGEIW